jgi:serine/threonine protein kinase/WD40 repeat protein
VTDETALFVRDRSSAGSPCVTEPDESLDPLDEMAEEFLERLRRGQRPDITQFAARIPGQAAEVREFLSALMLVEGLKPRPDATVDALWSRAPGIGPPIDRLGDFRILRELGRGGMGVVYEAEQESLGRHVALKVLAPAVARSPHQTLRFVREARAAARLHHTNIVPVFGVGEHDGLHYYVMQYIRGMGLDKVLEEVRRLRGQSPPEANGAGAAPPRRSPREASVTVIAESIASGQFEHPHRTDSDDSAPVGLSALAGVTDSDVRYAHSVARIGLQVAEALEYAHQQGTLHRDIKPSNILLDTHGIAWVTDFGLAKAAEDEDLTRTGDVVGTIRYMAPERFRGLADKRSDVYGLGLALYEMLALRPAYGASDRESLLYQVNHVEPPRLHELHPGVARDLETIVHKAIEKDAAHRYATAADLAEDLRRFLEHRPIRARRVGATERLTRWARRNPGLATLGTALAGMLALVVVVIAAADVRLRSEHAEALRHLHRADRAEADAVNKLRDSYVAQARASRRSRFAGRRFDGLEAIRAAARLDRSERGILELRNEAIACLALPDIRPLPRFEGKASEGYLGVDFDPVSGQLTRGTPEGEVLIRTVDGDGLAARLPGNGLRAVLVQYSNDGRYLAVKHEDRGELVLAVWELSRREKILDVPDGMYSDAVDFHPDGRTLAAGLRDGSIVFYDLVEGREVRRLSPVTVARMIRFDPAGGRIAVVSPNSREGVQVRLVADGTVAASWALPEPEYSLDWHPDGRWLAVGAQDGRILLLDTTAPARPPRTLEGHHGQTIAVAFHPRGELLASASWDGTLRIWDPRTAQELVQVPLPEARLIRFSRDGRLLGPGHDVGSSWLWELAEGVECRELVGDEGRGAKTWSVDYLGPEGVLVSAGGSGVRLELPDRSGTPAFLAMPGTKGVAVAPDGSCLITSGATGLLRWPVRRPDPDSLRVGPPEPVGPIAGVPTGRVRLGRDGRSLAVVLDEEDGRVLVFDLETRTSPIVLAGHPNMERVAISPDGNWIATGTWRGTLVKVWDAHTGALVRDLPVKGSAEVLFSPDGSRLVTATGQEYTIWDVGAWTPRTRIPRSQASGLPGVAAFTPDGRLLALARTRSTVQLVDPDTAREIATLESPELQNVSGLGFSPDGRELVATFNTAKIQAWSLDAIRRGLASLDLDWPEPTSQLPPAPTGALPLTIAAEDARWLAPLGRAESFARSGSWDEAASSYDEAIAQGAPHVDALARRILFRRVHDDEEGYRRACRQLLERFDVGSVALRTVNDIAWSCALGPSAVEDYGELVRLAEASARSRPAPNRMNTVGALLYRAGRFEDAVRQLERSVAAHGAGGTQYDALFLAMAHHRLGHAEEAMHWLDRGTGPAPKNMSKPDASGDTSWIPRLELDTLRREAMATIGLAVR